MGEQFFETQTQNEQKNSSGSHEEAHAAASDAAKGAHDQAHAAAQEAAAAAHEAAASAAHEAAAAAAASAAGGGMSGMTSSTEYLQNVGNFVAAALDPLGIDVQVDIETPDGNRNTVKSSSAETKVSNQRDKSMSPSDDEEEWTVVSEKKSEEKTVEIPIQVTGQETEKAQHLYPSLPKNVPEEGMNANQVTSQSGKVQPSVSSNQSVASASASSSTAEAVAKASGAPSPLASHPDPKIQ